MIKLLIKKMTKIRGKADKKMNIDVKELEVMEDICFACRSHRREKRKIFVLAAGN